MSAVDFFKSTTTHYVHVSCGECHIEFYIPQSKYEKCREKGSEFYCPNGHNLVYRTTKVQQLEKQLEEEKRKVKWAQDARDYAQKRADRIEKSRAAIKGVLTKTKNRIKNGVCPCCTRTFSNLAMHMKNQHPEYKPWEHEA